MISMETLINAYLDWLEGARNSKTFKAYKSALHTFADIVGNDAPLTQKTYATFLKKTTDMNPATQALHRSAIRGLYYFAANDDQTVPISFFPQTDRQLALKPGKRLPMFNREGIEQIIGYCSTIRNTPADLRDRAFVFLLADSGLRVFEACALRVGDVDLLEQRAVVVGKGNKQAVVNISNRTAQAIREYLQARQVSKSQPLFIRHDKKVGDAIKPVTAGGMWHVIKQRAMQAGADPKTIRVHDFRHYFVTIVYHAKGIKAAQELARHERIETTSLYTHLVDNSSATYDEIFNR
jgi:integrase/recombinase XerC